MNVRSDLFIDRISVTIQINREEHDFVKGSLEGLATDGTLLKECDRYSELLKGYRYAYRLMFNDRCFCAIQVHPRKPGHRFMRLEWNPDKAERNHPNAIGRILGILAECVPSYSPQLILNATITRIDLTFDLIRIPIDSFFVNATLRKNHSGQYLQFNEEFGTDGKLNARYIGRADGDQYLLMYDKRLHAEILQFRGNPQHGSESMTGVKRFIPARTRFELRLRRIGSWSDLFALANPFERYRVASLINVGGVKSDHHWKFFIAACEKWGSQAALSMIENRRERKRYWDALSEATPPTWWNPEEIWAGLANAVRRALRIAT